MPLRRTADRVGRPPTHSLHWRRRSRSFGWSGAASAICASPVRHYRLAGAHSGPVPVHPIGIWLGVYRPRALRLAGRLADGWVPSLRGEVTPLGEAGARLDEAATEAGRDPAE